MKKLFLLTAILIGAASASHAGVRFSFGLPLPPLPFPRIVVDEPYCAPAPTYCPPRTYYDAPAYCAPSYDYAPSVYFGFGDDCYRGSRYYGHGDYYRRDYYRGGDHYYRGGDRYRGGESYRGGERYSRHSRR